MSDEWLLVWAIVWITTAVVMGDIFSPMRSRLSNVPIVSGVVVCLLCFVIYVSAAAVGVSSAAAGGPAYRFFLQVFGYAGLAWALSELITLAERLASLLSDLKELVGVLTDELAGGDGSPEDEAAALAVLRSKE